MKATLTALVFAAALAAGGPAAAADYRAPRNALGQPDLQGVWNTHFVLPMEARPDMPRLTLPEAEAAAYARKLSAEAGKLASSPGSEVAEIRGGPQPLGPGHRPRPAHAASGAARRRDAAAHPVRARPDAASSRTRCAPRIEAPFPKDGPEVRPIWGTLRRRLGPAADRQHRDINPRQIIRTRDAVVISDGIRHRIMRIIPFADRHRPAAPGVARWATRSPTGRVSTLVIEDLGHGRRRTRSGRSRPLFVSADARCGALHRVSKGGALQYIGDRSGDLSRRTVGWRNIRSTRRLQADLRVRLPRGNYSLPNHPARGPGRGKSARGGPL
jgi:hypothetical protein